MIVDDCANRYLAPSGNPGGQCITVDKSNYKMHFDGWKCHFKISKPQPSGLTKYKTIELTSMLEYAPQRRYSHRAPDTNKLNMREWRARLGYPSFEVTKSTLDHTTHMVTNFQAETREYMRDNHKTRAWDLRPRRIDDVMHSDTFSDPVCSIRGYK